jgi:hypothetical protein
MRRPEIVGGLGLALVSGALFALARGTIWALIFLLTGLVLILHAILGHAQGDNPPTRLTPTLKEMCEAREAQARMKREEIERDTAKIRHHQTAAEWAGMQRCQKIDEYYRAIKEMAERERSEKGGGIRIPMEVAAAPGEDPELVKEAWMKYKAEVEEKVAGDKWRGGRWN